LCAITGTERRPGNAAMVPGMTFARAGKLHMEIIRNDKNSAYETFQRGLRPRPRRRPAGICRVSRLRRDDGDAPPAYYAPSNRREPDMALKRMVLEIGMGTDIRGGDDTKAAVRALRDALWHNSLSVAAALGLDTDSMQVEVTIGTPHPEKVDKAQVLAVLPHGTGTVTVVQGGLEIPNDEGTNVTLLAQAAAVVWLDVA
jgi:uncharacterized protein (TIGR02058 family)